MKTTIISILLVASSVSIMAERKDSGISSLDEAISKRGYYIEKKEACIDSLLRLINPKKSKEDLMKVYDRLFQEYLAFKFDSALKYADMSSRLVDESDSYDMHSQVKIHRALSLATSGHFSHAINILNGIDSQKLSRNLQEQYFSACEWTYGVWAEYSDKKTIAPEFTERRLVYLDSLISVTDQSKPEYIYRLAERSLRNRDYREAEKKYKEVLKLIPTDSRLYAQAAYALALTYKGLGDSKEYKKWLVNAAISDQKVPLKENLALQQLALHIKEEDGDLERANSYLKLALEDAIFYNNRLRMLEIAEKIPDIANVYQNTIERHNRHLKVFIIMIGILMLAFAALTWRVFRQRAAIDESKKALEELNDRLRMLNTKLSETNRSREQYVSLFMDLCAAYIEKLNRLPMVLKLKIKQVSDVNSVAERYVKPTETESREMFQNFDTAFLRLYPDFLTEFNALLKPEKQILPKKGELLNTDLRIYALVRLGITDSNRIATLLFLSPQTIFNHRTQVRNRALNRETFETQVAGICKVSK